MGIGTASLFKVRDEVLDPTGTFLRAKTAQGGGSSYVAKAVHFDGNTWLASANALGGVDGTKGILSLWAFQVQQNDLSQGGATAFLSDGTGQASTVFFTFGGTDTFTGLGFDIGYVHLSAGVNVDTDDDIDPVGQWFNWLVSWDLSGDSPLWAGYLNDAPLNFDHVIFNTSNVITYSDVINYVVGTYNGGAPVAPAILGDMSDFYFNSVDTIMESDGTISTANRRKFISAAGKPVSLGSDGSTPTGAKPLIFLSGDASSYSDNLAGTGAFTVTGALTNATTSPSD